MQTRFDVATRPQRRRGKVAEEGRWKKAKRKREIKKERKKERKKETMVKRTL